MLITAVSGLILWAFGFDFDEYLDGGSAVVSGRLIDVVYLAADATVALVYYTPIMVAWEGRTLGKRALGIRVVRADGRPLGAGTVVVRQVLLQYLLVGLVPVVGLVNYLLPLFDDPGNRAGHDRIARTRVIRERR